MIIYDVETMFGQSFLQDSYEWSFFFCIPTGRQGCPISMTNIPWVATAVVLITLILQAQVLIQKSKTTI